MPQMKIGRDFIIILWVLCGNKNRVLNGETMFKKKKLYKIVYTMLCEYTVIIEAKDEFQAMRKFSRKMGDMMYSIISFEEYKIGQ